MEKISNPRSKRVRKKKTVKEACALKKKDPENSCGALLHYKYCDCE